jgi:hypothetical protein
VTDLEYPFERLPVEIDGFDAVFSGTAWFQPDPAGFWVACISLEGTDRNGCPLDRSGSILARHLFAAIEAALYADRHVAEAWAAHCENERADAA